MSKQVFTVGQVLTAAEMTTLQANDYNQTVSAKVASYVLVAADAGTRITMSNASATTVTVNTALFTAGDTLTITNIGVGVSTITAGTATVSTAGSLALNQYDSGTLYFTSTGVSIWNGANPGDITGVTAGTGLSGGGTSGTVSLAIDTAVTADLTTAQTMTNKTLTTPKISNYTTNGDLVYGTGSSVITRLGIGSSAQVLTVTGGVPVWATPASGGGMTLLSTTTLTGATTTISSISGSYKSLYLVIMNVVQATVDGSMFARMNADATASKHAYNRLRALGTTVNAAGSLTNKFEIITVCGAITSTVLQNGYCVMTIPRYTSTTGGIFAQWQAYSYYTSTSSQVLVEGSGVYDNTAAITSIELSGDYNFSSGTAYLYGAS